MEPNFVANGNISPSRACIVDTSYTGAGIRVIQDGTGGLRVIGVSQKGTRYAGGTGADDGFAAIAGEDIRLHTWQDNHATCGLELGGTVVAGASLKSDSSGKGVSTTTAADIIFAVALQGGVSGDVIQVALRPAGDYGG